MAAYLADEDADVYNIADAAVREDGLALALNLTALAATAIAALATATGRTPVVRITATTLVAMCTSVTTSRASTHRPNARSSARPDAGHPGTTVTERNERLAAEGCMV